MEGIGVVVEGQVPGAPRGEEGEFGGREGRVRSFLPARF